jgi:hypothetical protein
MCPATKDKDGPGTAYSEDHGKFIKLLFIQDNIQPYIKSNHASWTDMPSSMFPATKDKDGPGTAYSEDHGKFIKLLFMLL